MNYDGYIVSFVAGSRGRLIANIISKMLSNTSEKITYTKYNSAHNSLTDSYIRPIGNFESFKLGDDNVYKLTPVLLTHTFPDMVKINQNTDLKNKRIVVINVTSDNINETILNAIIKNVLPRVEDKFSGKTLDEREIILLDQWQRFFNRGNILLDEQVVSDPTQMLKFALGNPILINLAKHFYGHIIPDSDRVLNLDYGQLFDKDVQGKYNTLEKIAQWLCAEYDNSVYCDFQEYDQHKYDVFVKHCPWFLEEIK